MKVAMAVKHPPYAMEMEQSVLGGLMVSTESAVSVFGILSANDFYRADHQVIAKAIHALHESRKPHDYITVSEYLRDAGGLDNAGGVAYLGSLATELYSVANIERYAEIVREKSLRRRVIGLCSTVADAAYQTQGADDLAGMLAQGVNELLKASGSSSKKFSEWWGPTEDYIRAAKEKRLAGGTMGAAFGLPALDEWTGGIYGPRVYGIAARPGTGKTAILNQIAVNAASKGSPGLVLSLEMSGEELMIRALSAASQQNVTRVFHGHERESESAIAAAVQLGDLPLWIDTDTYALNKIVAQIAAHKHKHGIQWAAIDHVGLIETEKFNTRNDQIGHITRKLKQTAKTLGIPIIALFQLSRLSEKENRKPGLFDLRDSGNIEQDLDVAIFLHVEPDKRDLPTKPVEIGVLKNRNGRVGWPKKSIYEFNGAIQTFREISL